MAEKVRKTEKKRGAEPGWEKRISGMEDTILSLKRHGKKQGGGICFLPHRK